MCLGGPVARWPALRALALATHLGPTVAVTTVATLLAVAAGVPGGPGRAGLRGRPRRSGVHRLEQRLARRRPRPGRRAGRQARRPGRGHARRCCARRRSSRPRWPSSCRSLLGVVPGLLLLVLVASGWAYNAGLKRTAASVRPLRRPVSARCRPASSPRHPGRRSRPGGWSPPAGRSAPRRTWPTSPPTWRTTWRPASAGLPHRLGARRLGAGRRALLLGRRVGRARARAGRSTDGGGLGGPGARRARRSWSPRPGRHRAVPPARLPGGDAADRARRRPAAARRGRGHLTAAPPPAQLWPLPVVAAPPLPAAVAAAAAAAVAVAGRRARSPSRPRRCGASAVAVAEASSVPLDVVDALDLASRSTCFVAGPLADDLAERSSPVAGGGLEAPCCARPADPGAEGRRRSGLSIHVLRRRTDGGRARRGRLGGRASRPAGVSVAGGRRRSGGVGVAGRRRRRRRRRRRW